MTVAKVAMSAGASLPIYLRTHWQLDFFLIGMALRLAYRAAPRAKGAIAGIMAAAVCAAAYAGAAWIAAHTVGGMPLFPRVLGMPADFMGAAEAMALGVSAMLIYAAGFWSARLSALLSARPLRWLAGISYSLYLVHLIALNYPLFRVTDPRALVSGLDATSRMFILELVAIELIACIGVALVFYALVERPMLVLRKRFYAGESRPRRPADQAFAAVAVSASATVVGSSSAEPARMTTSGP